MNRKQLQKMRMSRYYGTCRRHTDRKITANRPDTVIKDHKTKTCKFIDMAVPSDRNTSVKVTEKLSKYKDLEIETNRTWGMRTETMFPFVRSRAGLSLLATSCFSSLRS